MRTAGERLCALRVSPGKAAALLLGHKGVRQSSVGHSSLLNETLRNHRDPVAG